MGAWPLQTPQIGCSFKAYQECMRNLTDCMDVWKLKCMGPWAGKDTVYISNNEVRSINPRVERKGEHGRSTNVSWYKRGITLDWYTEKRAYLARPSIATTAWSWLPVTEPGLFLYMGAGKTHWGHKLPSQISCRQPRSPEYLLPAATSISAIAHWVSFISASPHASCQLPTVKLSGGHGDQQIFLTQWPLSSSVSSLNQRLKMLLQSLLSTVCSQIHHMSIYRETYVINVMSCCCNSCDCINDEYDRLNALWLWHHKNHCWENATSSFLQSCAAVSAAIEFSCWPDQQSQLLSNSPADKYRGLSYSIVWLSDESNLVVSCMHLHKCRSSQEHLRMLLQSLGALCLAPGGLGASESIKQHWWGPLEYLQCLPVASEPIYIVLMTKVHECWGIWWDLGWHSTIPQFLRECKGLLANVTSEW